MPPGILVGVGVIWATEGRFAEVGAVSKREPMLYGWRHNRERGPVV